MYGIGKNLKRIRLIKDLTLKEAGELLNMSASTISRYENEKILPDSKKVIEFANGYNVKAIEILKVYEVPPMTFEHLHIK